MIKVSEHKHRGFTLIEVILTLVIVAIVGAGLVQYLGSAFTKSSIPIQRLGQAFELQQVMENITADYLENYTSDMGTLTANIGNNDYGLYTVEQNYFISFDGTSCDAGVNCEMATSTPNLLKVTIKNDSGDLLSTIFSLLE